MAGEWNYTSGKWNGDANDKGNTFSHLLFKRNSYLFIYFLNL